MSDRLQMIEAAIANETKFSVCQIPTAKARGLPCNGFREDIWFRQLLKLIKKDKIKSIYVENTPITTLSSTFIRNEIKNGKDIMFYVHDSVYNIIKEKKLYG